MSNPRYLFRFPKDMPRFDFASLDAWLGERQHGNVGTTVRIARYLGENRIEVFLYDFWIATIYPDIVTFLPNGDEGHMTTTAWISLIARHNGIAALAWRIRRRKSDGPGVPVARGFAGLLVFGGREQPVVGKTYPVDLDNRPHTLTWQEIKEEVIAAHG